MLVVATAGLTVVFLLWRADVEMLADESGVGIRQVISLQSLPWASAETGWRGIAQSGAPAVNASFATGPLKVLGDVYPVGIGVYPTSEISYQLDKQHLGFRVSIAIDDNTPAGQGHTRFLVYGDDRRLFDSGVLTAGGPPRLVRISVAGVEELRLVTIDESDRVPGYAAWLKPELRREVTLEGVLASRPEPVAVRRAPRTTLDERRREQAAPTPTDDGGAIAARQGRRRPGQNPGPNVSAGDARTQDQAELRIWERQELASIQSLLDGTLGEAPLPLATYDATRARYLLLSEDLAVVIGYGGEQLAAMSVFDRRRGIALLRETSPRITLSDRTVYRPDRDLIALEMASERTNTPNDPEFGPGAVAEVRMLHPRDGAVVSLKVGLYQRGFLLVEMALQDAPASAAGAVFDLFDLRRSEVVLGENVRFVTGYGRPAGGSLRRDGALRTEPVDEGKPVLLWSEDLQRSLVLGTLNPTGNPAEFEVQLPARQATGRLRFSATNVAESPAIRSPRFYLAFPATTNPVDALAGYREVFATLYPSLEQPPWFRFEWNSWYNYYMDINEGEMHAQIDFIADYLSDIGPWQVALDAGWYRAEGGPEADWRSVDTDKFPSGIAELADFAHSRDVRMSLYFSAPYLDNRARPVNWLGLRGLIEAHPEFLIPIDKDETGEGYLYNVQDPAFQDYFRQLMQEFFVTYGVDGIEVDGLGTVPSAIGVPQQLRDRFGIVRSASGQTMDWYRLIHDTVRSLRPDAYIYAGWHLPLFANQYAHAFWYSDEYPSFSNPYPYGGLSQHVDYAILQQGMWGQRSHMGYAYGDPNVEPAPRWWLEAAIALGTQISLGFDLRALHGQVLSDYRARLVHYHPHEAPIFTVGAYPPDAFGTHRQGTTYLGLMNRDNEARDILVSLQEAGLDAALAYTAYDVSAGAYLSVREALEVPMAPESFRLFLLRAEPGVMWTDSSYQETLTPDELVVTTDGPGGLAAFMEIATPEPRVVLLNGIPLDLGGDLAEDVSARYDPAMGVLRLQYPHDRHTITVRY